MAHHRHEMHKKHKKHGGKIHDEFVKHGEHHNKMHGKHKLSSGGSAERNEFGNANVLKEAREGAEGEHHIAGGTHSKLGRKRGGKAHHAHHGHHGHHRAHGGHVGADKHPFSSAANAMNKHGEDD